MPEAIVRTDRGATVDRKALIQLVLEIQASIGKIEHDLAVIAASVNSSETTTDQPRLHAAEYPEGTVILADQETVVQKRTPNDWCPVGVDESITDDEVETWLNGVDGLLPATVIHVPSNKKETL